MKRSLLVFLLTNTPWWVAGADRADQVGTWRGLQIAPEERCSEYDRGDYPIPPALEDEIVAVMEQIYEPYTGRCFEDTTDTTVEHIVAVSEAHDSGLCSADAETKKEFSRDPLNLTLASPHLNSVKGDRDAAEWLPGENRCWFADRVLQVRLKYDLTIDQAEADALELILARCESTELKVRDCSEDQPEPCPSGSSTLIFPQYVDGEYGGFQNRTRLILLNLAATTDNPVIVRYLDDMGQVVDSQTHTVPARGLIDLSTSGEGPLKVGPLTVESELAEDSLLRGSVVYELLGHRVSVPAAKLTDEATVFVSKSPQENTGIALFNPNPEDPVELELALHDADGSRVGQVDLTLEPGQHLARYMDEAPLFPDALGPQSEFVGHAIIRSTEDGQFAVVSILQDTRTGAVALVTPGIR